MSILILFLLMSPQPVIDPIPADASAPFPLFVATTASALPQDELSLPVFPF